MPGLPVPSPLPAAPAQRPKGPPGFTANTPQQLAPRQRRIAQHGPAEGLALGTGLGGGSSPSSSARATSAARFARSFFFALFFSCLSLAYLAPRTCGAMAPRQRGGGDGAQAG